MPSVITFWQTHEDENEFLEHLAKTGEVIVFPFGKVQNREELKPVSLPVYCAKAVKYEVVLTLSEFENDVIVSPVSLLGVDSFTLSPLRSPLIGYSPVEFRDGKLIPANIYVYWEILRPDGVKERLVKQPEAFAKWAKGVFRWLRKRANQEVEGKTLPMTERARTALEGGMELVHY